MSGKIIAEARRWLGTPYRHRAATRGAGCDCLGLVRGVWRELYGREPQAVPPYGADWRAAGDGGLERAARRHMVAVEGQPLPGHLVLFALVRHRPPRHCAIMVEAGRFIHAQEQVGVVEADLTEAWQRRIAGVFAFPGQ
ncbi:NlpC/P60 family protein [Pelagibacterium sediminicola]|uniref:NlpC/P60 family protein n=1 Tax=Pelagibacterium sediminicola TaxID=2248761 RepID=UPI000E32026F|nr:NlpC/P60 family protein [Pelagibacterium sediminicola]